MANIGQISLVAYTAMPGKIFVKVPNERGRYLITDIEVAHRECGQCKALKGEPCFRIVQGLRSYTAGTHYIRRGRRRMELTVPELDRAASAANEIADQFTPGFFNDDMVDDVADIIRKHHK